MKTNVQINEEYFDFLFEYRQWLIEYKGIKWYNDTYL